MTSITKIKNEIVNKNINKAVYSLHKILLANPNDIEVDQPLRSTFCISGGLLRDYLPPPLFPKCRKYEGQTIISVSGPNRRGGTGNHPKSIEH